VSNQLLRVAATIEGAHPQHTDYPLLEGDVLTREPDGTYIKHAPGLGVAGFELTADQAASLQPVEGRIELL
jgi:hypothetical protein